MTPQETETLPNDTYWAAAKTEDLPSVIRAKAQKYRQRLETVGYLDLYRRAERTYYGLDSNGGMSNSAAVTFGGENGENVMFRVNHAASMVQSLVAMVLSKRLAYEPQAANTDSASADATTLTKSLLEHYVRTLKLEEVRTDRTRQAVVYGSAFTALRWNPHIGKVHTTEDVQSFDEYGRARTTFQQSEDGSSDEVPLLVAKPVKEGDLEANVFNVVQVIHDLDSTSPNMDWVLLPYRENVWNLVERYPEKRQELLALRGSAVDLWPRTAWEMDSLGTIEQLRDPDIVNVWWLYHDRCDALPEGRMSIVAGDVVLHDGDFLLDEVPCYELQHEKRMGTKEGHTRFWDILALSDVYDSLSNTAQTSLDAFGSQVIIAPKGSALSLEDIGPNKILYYQPTENGQGKPEGLNLLQVPEALKTYTEKAQREMESILNVNSVVRGDPPPNLKSGASLALVQSLAVESNGQFQAAIVRADERLASGIIALLKKYAANRRVVEIVGAANAGEMMEWSRDDLATIDRVQIDIGTAMQNTEAGKLEIANQLVVQKLITTPQEYLEVLTTGRLEPIYAGPKAELDLIARENEALSKGRPVKTVLTDDHALHVQEHKAVLASPEVRFNERLSKAVLDHIKEHEVLFQGMGPVLGVLTAQTVAPPPQPGAAPMTPPPPIGAPPGGPHAGPALAPPEVSPNKARPLGQPTPNPAHMPSMPTIAGTNLKAPQPR